MSVYGTNFGVAEAINGRQHDFVTALNQVASQSDV